VDLKEQGVRMMWALFIRVSNGWFLIKEKSLTPRRALFLLYVALIWILLRFFFYLDFTTSVFLIKLIVP